MSSAQAHLHMKRFWGDLAWQFSKHRLEKSKTRACVPFFSSPSIIPLGLTVSLGMGLFDAKTSTRMRKELNERKLPLWYSSWTFSQLQILLFHSPGRRWRSSCMCERHMLAWSMHSGAQELCVMGSQQGDGSIPCCHLLSLSLYSHIFSSVESSISLLLHCMSEYLNFGTREAERLFWPADVFYVLHRLAGLTHFTSSLQLEVTCGGELLSVSASGKGPLQYCPLTHFGHNRLIFLWFIQLCQALI